MKKGFFVEGGGEFLPDKGQRNTQSSCFASVCLSVVCHNRFLRPLKFKKKKKNLNLCKITRLYLHSIDKLLVFIFWFNFILTFKVFNLNYRSPVGSRRFLNLKIDLLFFFSSSTPYFPPPSLSSLSYLQPRFRFRVNDVVRKAQNLKFTFFFCFFFLVNFFDVSNTGLQ